MGSSRSIESDYTCRLWVRHCDSAYASAGANGKSNGGGDRNPGGNTVSNGKSNGYPKTDRDAETDT